MKFGHSPDALLPEVDRTIAMCRAVESPQIHEMAGMLILTHSRTAIDTDAVERSCNRVAAVAEGLGLGPDDMQKALAEHDTMPVPGEIDWFTIVALHKAEESESA